VNVYKQVGNAVSIDIRGAKGPNAVTINGTYDPTDELCNEWPVYQKRGDQNKWMEYFNQSNKWYIKATNDKGINQAIIDLYILLECLITSSSLLSSLVYMTVAS